MAVYAQPGRLRLNYMGIDMVYERTCIALQILSAQNSSRIMDEFYQNAMRQVALYGAAYYRINADGYFEFYDPRDIYLEETSN
jgi:hypothetical protein